MGLGEVFLLKRNGDEKSCETFPLNIYEYLYIYIHMNLNMYTNINIFMGWFDYMLKFMFTCM
jgi:hypothetical protein